MTSCSCISRFYRLSMPERRARIGEVCQIPAEELGRLVPAAGLEEQQAERMVENALGVFGLPFGVCVNLRINGRDVLAPMVVEEPSVIAACSYAAKLLRAGGGVEASCSDPIVIGQIQVLEVPDPDAAEAALLAAEAELLERASAGHPRLVEAGGGARSIRVRRLPRVEGDDPCGDMLVVHLAVDVRDAMGANAINSMCERLAPRVAELTGGRVALRILSNLTDERTVTVVGRVPYAELEGKGAESGEELAKRIEEASVFAERDPYRACTHNKGIMNGVDAALIALGQDWRAVEAGAHAHAAKDGRYTAMARWRAEDGHLVGRMTIPLAVGTVGGVAKSHPVVQVARRIANIEHADEMAWLCAAVGLAQNLGALRALAAEGIQKGHMRLHARNVAVEAGAAEHEVLEVAQRIADAGRVNARYAAEVIAELRAAGSTVASPPPGPLPQAGEGIGARPRLLRPSTPPSPSATPVSRPAPAHRPLFALEGRIALRGADGPLGAHLARALGHVEAVTIAVPALEAKIPGLRELALDHAESFEGCRYAFLIDPEPEQAATWLEEAARAGVARVVVAAREDVAATLEPIVADAPVDAVLVRTATILGAHDHAPSTVVRALIEHARGGLKQLPFERVRLVRAEDAATAAITTLTRGRRGEGYAAPAELVDADTLMTLFEEVTGQPRPRRRLEAILGGLWPRREPPPPPARPSLGLDKTDLRRAVHEAHADLARRGLVPARVGTTEPPVVERSPRLAKRAATAS